MDLSAAWNPRCKFRAAARADQFVSENGIAMFKLMPLALAAIGVFLMFPAERSKGSTAQIPSVYWTAIFSPLASDYSPARFSDCSRLSLIG